MNCGIIVNSVVIVIAFYFVVNVPSRVWLAGIWFAYWFPCWLFGLVIPVWVVTL